MNSIEGNKIIAKFDGRKFKAYKDNSSYNDHFDTYAECQEFILLNRLYGYAPEIGYRLGMGKYHSSWDWLMPVVEKIEGIDKYFTIERNTAGVSASYGTNGNDNEDKAGLWFITKVQIGESKIEAVWLAVVEFIKWHNNQNK